MNWTIRTLPIVLAILLLAVPLAAAAPFTGSMETWTGVEWSQMPSEAQAWFVRGFMVATYVTTWGMSDAPPDQVEATRAFMAKVNEETDTEIRLRVSRYYATRDLTRPIWQVIFAGGR